MHVKVLARILALVFWMLMGLTSVIVLLSGQGGTVRQVGIHIINSFVNDVICENINSSLSKFIPLIRQRRTMK